MYVCMYVSFTKVPFDIKKILFSYGLVPLQNFSFARHKMYTENIAKKMFN